jgi:hypothetical protein
VALGWASWESPPRVHVETIKVPKSDGIADLLSEGSLKGGTALASKVADPFIDQQWQAPESVDSHSKGMLVPQVT